MEVVEDEESAARKVFAQKLEVLALRQPVTLARLLQDTNRLAEAESLMRRALAIFIESLGLDRPSSQVVRGNYIALLQAMGRTDDEISAKLASVHG